MSICDKLMIHDMHVPEPYEIPEDIYKEITDLEAQLTAADDEIVRLREGCIELEKNSVPFKVFKTRCNRRQWDSHEEEYCFMSGGVCTEQTCPLMEGK